MKLLSCEDLEPLVNCLINRGIDVVSIEPGILSNNLRESKITKIKISSGESKFSIKKLASSIENLESIFICSSEDIGFKNIELDSDCQDYNEFKHRLMNLCDILEN